MIENLEKLINESFVAWDWINPDSTIIDSVELNENTVIANYCLVNGDIAAMESDFIDVIHVSKHLIVFINRGSIYIKLNNVNYYYDIQRWKLI